MSTSRTTITTTYTLDEVKDILRQVLCVPDNARIDFNISTRTIPGGGMDDSFDIDENYIKDVVITVAEEETK